MEKKRIYISDTCGSTRIYVEKPISDNERKFFDAVSIWGGPDKQGENYLSWEFTNDYKWINN